MALTSYTTYDTIRGLLGVGPLEIKDSALALAPYELTFLLEMEDLDGGVGKAKVLYNTISLIVATTRTVPQQRYWDLFNLCAAYSTARQLVTSAPMFAPQEIHDGKAAIKRFDAPFDTLKARIDGGYSTLLARLKALLGTLDGTAAVTTLPTRRYIGSVGLAKDPVTGV